jgi:hypothetical protein
MQNFLLKIKHEAVPKCQILEQLPKKNVVLQAVGRKTTEACDKTTGFGTSSHT